MSIDTEIPGDPAAVYAVADWLEGLRAQLEESARVTRRIAGERSTVWTGDSADAYGDFNDDLRKATEQIEDRADEVEGKTRAYAQQLAFRQEDMAGHRTRAREGGLTVTGFVISAPPAAVDPGTPPSDPTPAEKESWEQRTATYESARDRVELYDELLTDVRETFDRLDTWVRENLVTMESSASSPFSIAALAGVLAGLGFGIPENSFARKARDLRADARRSATDLARRRSGNPAVRSGSTAPRADAVARASRPGTRAGNLAGLADEASTWGRWFARGGVVTAVALGAWEISQGKSPSTVAVETGTGLLVGAGLTVAAGAAIAAGAPVVVTVGAVVVVGAAATYAAGWAYETFVPQDVREKIDEGIRDTWEGAKDLAGDVGGAISDGWDAVFG